MYFDSAIDREIDDCFLLNQDMRILPRKNVPPLVIFYHILSSEMFQVVNGTMKRHPRG